MNSLRAVRGPGRFLVFRWSRRLLVFGRAKRLQSDGWEKPAVRGLNRARRKLTAGRLDVAQPQHRQQALGRQKQQQPDEYGRYEQPNQNALQIVGSYGLAAMTAA